MVFLNHKEGDMVFLLGFPPFFSTMYNRNCKRLREFEEIEISRESCRGDCE